ncbi:MAG: peptidylprolyl isomerase [Alphaproteobacteria bacterium]|nr:peptidylprolyl isomerase [Alphaproteobacteria bacterium]
MGASARFLGRTAAVAGAVAALLGLLACGEAAVAPGAPAVIDSDVAAVVNGEPIYASNVQLEAESQGAAEPDKPLETDSAEFNRVLDQLIDVKLLALEAESRALHEDPQARHRLEAAREHILGNILVEAVVSERVDEAAIRKMYEAQIAIWELGDEAHVRHIVAATREDIEAIVAELNKGADFAVLASRKSIDEGSRLEGGDLGYMTEDEALPEIARVIRSTPAGGLSKPFETAMGWHVARIEERRKEQPPTLEELREPILKHLTMMQIGEVLKELRTEARIEKLTSPQNSTIDVDPFDLAPEEEPGRRPSISSFEAAAPRPPVSETRSPVPPPEAPLVELPPDGAARPLPDAAPTLGPQAPVGPRAEAPVGEGRPDPDR